MAMDRATLVEKQRHMFFAGDSYFMPGGNFSPAGKYKKTALTMKAELAGDTGANDRVMYPSLQQ